MSRGDSASAIVVGAGVWGGAIAAELVQRGWKVTWIEKWGPGNARGSSGDRTRMLRAGYSSEDEEADLWYARSARRSLARWRELQQEDGVQLLHEVPLLWLASEHDGVEQAVIERLRAVELEPEVLAPDQLGELFPSVSVEDLAFAVLEPEAAIIRASAAVEVLVRRALRGGAELLLERAVPAREPGAVRAGARTLRADRVVWACGSWLGGLFPGEACVTPTWQDVVYWNSPPDWRTSAAWFDEQERLYGFPDLEGLGVKAVTHLPGRPIDPDKTPRQVDARVLDNVSRYLGWRFPALAGVPLLWGRVMHYEMTPDGHFAIGFRSADERSLIAGGGSGHGFKHAPTIGVHVADLLEGKAAELPRFALGERAALSVWR